MHKKEIYFDQEEFVVVDMGTGYIKAGFSGEDLPRCVCATTVCEQKIEADPNAATSAGQDNMKPKTIYSVGKKAFEIRQKTEHPENLNMHFPVQRGIVDFDREGDYLKELL